MKKLLFTAIFALVACTAWAQSPVGKWKTIDDETGKAKSIVEIYQKEGQLYGKVVELLNRGADEEQNPICDDCDTDDPRYNEPVIGMEILKSMEKDGDEWKDGTILDPKKGKVYDCKIWINEDDSDQLMVRGYVAFFYRTQTWYRMN